MELRQAVSRSDNAASAFAVAPNRIAVPLFATTLFLSAFLVFCVQPMFTRMVLPLLGGSPAVWNTAVMFFQAVLLIGYTYVHLTTRYLNLRTQIFLHLLVLAAATVALPIAVAKGWAPPADGTPVYWLIGLLGVSLGLPFFAVSATAPLLQRWFVHSGHPAAADPYFLYGASNLGSLFALLSYPVLTEPLLRLAEQSFGWTLGYTLLLLLIGGCSLAVLRWSAAAGPAGTRGRTAAGGEQLSWGRRAHWLALAFVPSSLLMGVTTHIGTDVAAVPLLWVIPLTLYLLTFVLIFARRPLIRHDWMVRMQPFFLLPLAATFGFGIPLWLMLPLHLGGFFVTAMVCHGELGNRRPGPEGLTEFYFWMSLGGMLGGVFNVLVAPVAFEWTYEYPMALALACLLRPLRASPDRFVRWSDLVLPALFLLILPISTYLQRLGLELPGVRNLLLYLTPALGVAYFFRDRPVAFGLGFAAAFVVTTSMASLSDNVLARERSFFGINTVKRDESGRFNLLINGNTVHGAEWTDPALRREPLTYYSESGPLGRLFAAFDKVGRPQRVGVVGLGVGTTACYRGPGESWTFFEIDPAVERLARDPSLFHYMADCAGDAPVVIGDARQSLAALPDRSYDLLILDAFSSDAIPVHLLTREALRLYLAKLDVDGIIALHISNRMLDLEPVVANIVADAGAAALIRDQREGVDLADRKTPSVWVVIARSSANLAFLRDEPAWVPLDPRPDFGLWADDFSNILQILRWH